MALVSRPFGSLDDLRAMQAAITAAWLTSRRPFVLATIGDVAWWMAQGGPEADWPSRIRIWTEHGRTVGWGWISPPNGLDWFTATDLGQDEEHRLRLEILAWGSERIATLAALPAHGSPPPALEAWAADGWPEEHFLTGLGFTPTEETLTQYFQSLDRELPEPVVAPGYTVRAMAGPDEIPARVEVHRSAFAPSKMTVEKYAILVGLEPYRYELDAVVEAPDGTFAAFTMCWLDRAAELGSFEPVGVHADHRRRGLGKAVNTFGLRLLQSAGAREAMVFSGSKNAASEALYRSVGFSPIARHRAYTAPALQSPR
jgi:mycothiol synthase